MPCITDVGVVINGYYHLRKEGLGHSPSIREHGDSHIARSHPCNGSMFCICHEQKISASLTVPVSMVLRIHILHCSYVTKRKPCLHDGTVTTDLDKKNRLVEIPPSGEPPDTD